VDETENHINQAQADGQPRYYAELVEQIISQLEMFFVSSLDDMFKQADDHLFTSADSASSTAEQNSLFECMNALRVNKQAIQQGFVDELSVYLQPVGELEKLPERKQSKRSDELVLVEQNEMDEMVILTTISSKAAMDNAEAINHLVLRFKELAQYNDHIFHAEALEPKRLCDSMHEAVTKTDLIDHNKLVVYKFFDKSLIVKLVELYDMLNNMLIEQGILPVIDYSGTAPHYEEAAYGEEPVDGVADDPSSALPPGASAAPPPPPPGMRRAFGSGMAGYSGFSGAAPAGSHQAAPPMPAGGAPMSPPPAGQGGFAPATGAAPRRAFGSGMSGMFSQSPQPAVIPGGSAVTDGSSIAGTSAQPGSAGMPVSQVRESIESFVGGTHADGLVSADGFYSHQQVMTALTELQVPTGNISETPLVFDANQIKKAVLSSIGEREGGAVTKAVNQVSEKTIDFIKLIFDAIIEEESITDEIKTILLSLQIPVIKAAMIDSEFFVDDQHPARQLLDKISEAGVGVTEHTDPVYIEIEKVVRKLLSDYDDDVIAFTIALDELKNLTEEIYRKARETEDESQKTVKMAHARKIVLQEIRKITIGKELPEGIRTLVLKVWPSMMFNHFLNNGKANDEWVELLMILQKIIESVQPISSLEELEELGLSYQDIVDAAGSKLRGGSKHRSLIDHVLNDLAETYAGLMATVGLSEESSRQDNEPDGASDQPIAQQGAESEEDMSDELTLGHAETQAEPGQEAGPEVDFEAVAREKISRLPEGIAPGGWFIVYNGEDKPVRRLKLAVILVHDATIVFVDHLGNVVIEKDAGVFADEVEKGLSGIIMQHSVFDHALNSALQTIEH